MLCLSSRFALSSVGQGMQTGSASGGTAPGSVVMALKCAATARNAMSVKATVWNFPQKVKCLPVVLAMAPAILAAASVLALLPSAVLLLSATTFATDASE